MTTPNNPKPPKIHCERYHAALGVTDMFAALDFYTQKLGFTEGFRWGEPTWFAGLNFGDVQIFLETGRPNTDHALSFAIGDADELYAFHKENGVEIVEPIGDRPYGLRDYMAKDLDGNLLAFGHYIYNMGEPVVIERVDVNVRLEKRLAAMLEDLAEYKRMSVTSALEEILLHTSEPLGDGVASPHTKRQLEVIQELKKKHGIDYDTHASYRFVEKDATSPT